MADAITKKNIVIISEYFTSPDWNVQRRAEMVPTAMRPGTR